MTSVMAIIPARGGSKGIPGKNLALCAGRPLVDWVLEAASGSRLLTRRVLSSDSPEILDRSLWHAGITPMLRPAELAADETSTEAVMAHVIEQCPPADVYVLLQPTSPLTTSADIDGAIARLQEAPSFCDSIMSVVRSHAFIWEKGGRPPYDPQHRPRRQDLGERYEENGAIYAVTREAWERLHSRIGEHLAIYEMREEQRFQVDSPADLELCSWLLEKRMVPA